MELYLSLSMVVLNSSHVHVKIKKTTWHQNFTCLDNAAQIKNRLKYIGNAKHYTFIIYIALDL